MVLLLLETFDRKRPRGRLVLVFLCKLMDVRTIPVPFLPMGGGGRTDRSISGPFCGGVLAVLLSTQSTKGSLLLIITRAWRREIICGELPKGKVERSARTKGTSEHDRVGEWCTQVGHRRDSPDCLDRTWWCNLFYVIKQCGQLWKPLRFLRFRGGRFSRVHNDILRLFHRAGRILGGLFRGCPSNCGRGNTRWVRAGLSFSREFGFETSFFLFAGCPFLLCLC